MAILLSGVETDNSGRGHYEEYFSEIILNLDPWYRCSYLVLYPSSCWRHLVGQSINIWAIGRGHSEEHFCEIILNSYLWFRRYHYSPPLKNRGGGGLYRILVVSHSFLLSLRHNFVSLQYFENKLIDFHQILYMHSY